MPRKQPKRTPRPGVDEYGRTALHYAAADGNEAEVSRLLREGADANAQDDNGWSPLHFAAQAVSPSVTSLLLAAGARVDVTDSFGNTPLSKAVFSSKGNGSVIALLRGRRVADRGQQSWSVSSQFGAARLPTMTLPNSSQIYRRPSSDRRSFGSFIRIEHDLLFTIRILDHRDASRGECRAENSSEPGRSRTSGRSGTGDAACAHNAAGVCSHGSHAGRQARRRGESRGRSEQFGSSVSKTASIQTMEVSHRCETDRSGRFQFQPREERFDLVITHPTGYVIFLPVPHSKHQLITLDPWMPHRGNLAGRGQTRSRHDRLDRSRLGATLPRQSNSRHYPFLRRPRRTPREALSFGVSCPEAGV